jgi:hypothetical protein
MNSTDPRAQAAFDAAINHIKTTTAAVADRLADQLGLLATASTRIFERDILINAQLDLRRNISTFVLVFGDTLSKKVSREVRPSGDSTRKLAETDWQSLSLVDDDEVEEKMSSDRIGQAITHACEWELRELAAFAGALLGIGRADADRNPLRGEVLGTATFRAISSISNESESRKVLARELAVSLAKAMPGCYADILRDMKARGIQPVGLTVRGVEGPGNEFSRDRINSGYQTLSGVTTSSGNIGTYNADLDSGAATQPGGSPARSTRSGFDASGRGGRTGAGGGPSAPGARAGAGPGNGGRAAAGAAGGASRGGGGGGGSGDAELMALIRRLTFLATRPGDLGISAPGALGGGGGSGRSSGAGALAGSGSSGGADTAGLGGNSGLSQLMAVNLIRAHRDELRQASSGTLDHMVIDVVGSLFDQILSDPRVPPQMARQIARLQLPVLRVALNDNSFFSSRKHPVRRFVNRIASLACAFEEFDDGPGKQFLTRVRELVQEIVEGDFDQIDIYTNKLNELEGFIAQQAKQDVQDNASAVSTVDSKEADLRVQQRYMLQLQSALAPLAMDEYLRNFLAQVWSQALALGTKRDGVQSELAQRLRRVGRDLVLSVQPKGSPAMRKKFLMQLPPLMKDLNEGLQLIGWPEAAQKEFFGKLLPAHADSLKGQPLTELEYNLLAKQLEGVFNTAVPEPDAMLRNVPMTSTGVTEMEPQFSPEEAKRIGLVDESSVDWSGQVDIDLSADTEAGDTQPGDSTNSGVDLELDLAAAGFSVGLGPGLDINLDLSPSEPAEPSHGAQLIDHVKLGFAYQMHLNDQWQKVRLSHVSPGRAFFVFTRGKRHQETVSLTSRMLSRMCETNRFRAFENAYLVERATARARKQLAALSKTAKQAPPASTRH